MARVLYGYGSGWLVLAYVFSTMTALIGILIDEPGRDVSPLRTPKICRSSAALLPRLAAPLGIGLWLSVLWLMIAKPSL